MALGADNDPQPTVSQKMGISLLQPHTHTHTHTPEYRISTRLVDSTPESPDQNSTSQNLDFIPVRI